MLETSLENFDRVFAINVRGMFVATQAALRHMKSGGRIINIGSCVGESIGFGGMAPYSAIGKGRQRCSPQASWHAKRLP